MTGENGILPPSGLAPGPGDAGMCRLVTSLAGTGALAERLRPLLVAGDVVALWGDLGAGKTAFVRALIRAATGTEEEVPSPTFTLVQTYEPPEGPPFWHFDLYRLARPEEVWELGLEDALNEAVTLIEWPVRLGAELPPVRLDVGIAFRPEAGPEARQVVLLGRGPGWAGRIARLAADDAGEEGP